LREKISLLLPDQQDVIILRFIDGLSTKEVAEALRKNEAAVRQLQSKGLRSLRNILNNHEKN
jgi:RNA polymerase sigma-70 factor (ECF subfamily)